MLFERYTSLYSTVPTGVKFPDNWHFCWLTVVQRGCQLSGYNCILDPHILTKFLGDFAVVNENQKAGTFVSFITVTDGDIGQNGDFVAAVKPKDKFELIEDDIEGSLILVTEKSFDREIAEVQNVTVTVCDRGTPKQ